jgi:hypothetical protein
MRLTVRERMKKKKKKKKKKNEGFFERREEFTIVDEVGNEDGETEDEKTKRR